MKRCAWIQSSAMIGGLNGQITKNSWADEPIAGNLSFSGSPVNLGALVQGFLMLFKSDDLLDLLLRVDR